MRKPLKEHLDDLEAKSVIEKVERPTEWVNSVVSARKANGKLRLCLDSKPLNKALKRSHFPIEEVIFRLKTSCLSWAKPKCSLKSIARMFTGRENF